MSNTKSSRAKARLAFLGGQKSRRDSRVISFTVDQDLWQRINAQDFQWRGQRTRWIQHALKRQLDAEK